ncbi:MAG: hypothetical protein V1800_15375 [Candidatus Latescibacterota bacterium]
MRSFGFVVLWGASVLVSAFCISSNAAAWWETGHRMATSCAVDAMPEDMPAFFREQKEILEYLSGEGDRWRRYGPTLRASERPNHFMDLEMIDQDVTRITFPPDRYQALKSYFEQGDEIPGLLFYQIIEYTERLRGSFGAYRKDPGDAGIRHAIISYAGILAHYAADLAQPLHLTIHYNGRVNKAGKVVSNKGIHERFEGNMVDRCVTVGDCRTFMRAPMVLDDLPEVLKKAMLDSHALVDEVFRLDDAGKFGTPDAASKALVRARLAFGAQLLSDLWLTAWVTSAEEQK